MERVREHNFPCRILAEKMFFLIQAEVQPLLGPLRPRLYFALPLSVPELHERYCSNVERLEISYAKVKLSVWK